jgi:hypothetical protein
MIPSLHSEVGAIVAVGTVPKPTVVMAVMH